VIRDATWRAWGNFLALAPSRGRPADGLIPQRPILIANQQVKAKSGRLTIGEYTLVDSSNFFRHPTAAEHGKAKFAAGLTQANPQIRIVSKFDE